MLPRTNYEAMAYVYDAGRAISLEGLGAWKTAISEYIPRPEDGPVLDVGAGTGLFSNALADWFDTRVVGVEPSDAMRRRAILKRSHPRVTYVGGEGEHLPLRNSSCPCAWLSTVVHHFRDLRAAARELRRVLRPRKPVLIRGAFAGHTENITWLRFWPEAKALAERRWLSVDATIETFALEGLEVKALKVIPQTTSPDLRSYRELMAARADSTLVLLPDEDFARGLAALERAAALETSPTPVVDLLHLLVLQSPDQ